MVKKRIIKRITAICLTSAMAISLVGCVINPDKKSDGGSKDSKSQIPDDTKDAYAKIPEDTPEDRKTSAVLNGPDTPPSGQRYDEWKNITYQDDVEFDVKGYCQPVISSTEDPLEEGYTYPDYIDSHLKITDATVEPVGGEMKLRAGGYVDIKITAEWAGISSFTIPGEDSKVRSIFFQEINPHPFDCYTGTSLLNHTGEYDESNTMIQGEATDSGAIESDITWNSRVYKIFVSKDEKNSSFGSWDRNGNTMSAECSTKVEITCRVPADYDGLAFKITKDISGERPKCLDRFGNIISTPDLYADVLTDEWGEKHDVSEFYFIKASDLLKHFEGQHKSGNSDDGGI